jgi:hypothetical protein
MHFATRETSPGITVAGIHFNVRSSALPVFWHIISLKLDWKAKTNGRLKAPENESDVYLMAGISSDF